MTLRRKEYKPREKIIGIWKDIIGKAVKKTVNTLKEEEICGLETTKWIPYKDNKYAGEKQAANIPSH